ncbi:hypothetical protein BD410DRAFT_784719 [Rickenella mellea]|uniref:BTB domain-containing protein n=1 Tax=Rickenella mellea TaxID=50990 RepID=A0A4Y7QEJ1_9AGAM|nr:hypothetical protein BD410DRAFT_784719 [Rickenella mellea]
MDGQDPIEVPSSPRDKPEPHPDLWYSDGSVALIAEGTAFRVHGGLLAANSDIFKDMLRVPQPDLVETYEGVPIIYLSDTKNDLEHLLKVIYRFQCLWPEAVIEFDVLASLLRMSTKYLFTHIRNAVIARLQQSFPDTLSKWDKTPVPSASTAFQVVALARETNARVLLPAALYRCCQEPLETILRGARDSNGLITKLHAMDIEACMIGMRFLVAARRKHTFRFLSKGPRYRAITGVRSVHVKWSEKCAKLSYCGEFIQSFVQFAVRSGSWERHDALVRTTDELWEARRQRVCVHCLAAWKKANTNGRENVWNELPSYFNLSEWDVIRGECR